MFRYIVKLLFLCVFINNYVKAETDEEIKMRFVTVLLECANQYPLTPGDMEMIKDKKVESKNAKCMFACAYKKTGMMDDKGLLSVEGVIEMSKKYFPDNPEKAKKAEDFANACKSVNDVEVSDGDQGCERAGLIFKCVVEKAAEFNFSDKGV